MNPSFNSPRKLTFQNVFANPQIQLNEIESLISCFLQFHNFCFVNFCAEKKIATLRGRLYTFLIVWSFSFMFKPFRLIANSSLGMWTIAACKSWPYCSRLWPLSGFYSSSLHCVISRVLIDEIFSTSFLETVNCKRTLLTVISSLANWHSFSSLTDQWQIYDPNTLRNRKILEIVSTWKLVQAN